MSAKSTVSAEPAEDSSSASANLLVILGIKQTLNGVYEITPDSGPAFFLRDEYLTLVPKERLLPVKGGLGGSDVLFCQETKTGMQGVFGQEESADLLNAALVFSAERAALTYLARAEQCRFSLKQKLLKKSIDKDAVEKSLDYLEKAGALDDRRFAGAWLRSRYISHAEGRRKLEGELLKRGICKEDAKEALDEFFSERSEYEVCKRALKKCLKTSKDIQKVRTSLVRLGFSAKNIKKVIEEDGICS